MLLFVGLGNPDDQYLANRHNVGFQTIDKIVEANSFPSFIEKHGGLLSSGSISDKRILFFKPLSYMNKSGIPVSKIKSFFKINIENIFVIHDELDFKLGKTRVKTGGGHGGHNGLRSIDSMIGKNYHRVRIGIDKPLIKEMVNSHVLSDFNKEELPVIENSINLVVNNVQYLVNKQPEMFMTKITTR